METGEDDRYGVRHLQGVKVHHDTEIMHGILCKCCAEKQPGLFLIHVPKHHQAIRVLLTHPIQYRPRLEHKLVRREVGALEEDELVLVREIQRAGGVLG